MKSVFALLFLSFISCVSAARAQMPTISSTEPSRLMVEPDALGEATVTLNGSRLVRSDTTGFTFGNDVQVFVRATTGAGAFQPLALKGWSGSKLTVALDKKTFMSRPDRLEFKVVVRGVGDSNLKTVEVMPYPTAPPHIEASESVRAVRSMPLDADKNSFDRTVSLQVRNLTADTKVFIRGKEASIGRLIPGDESVTFWIPQDFQRLGDYYTVHLENRNGKSNATRVLVVTSPGILSVNPSAIETTGAEENRRVKIDFVSLQKPEVFIRGEGNASNWQPVMLSEANELTIPKNLLAESGTLQIKLKNIGGETVADVPVKRVVMIDSSVKTTPKIASPIDPKTIRIIKPRPPKPPR